MDSNVHSATFHCCALHFKSGAETITDDVSVERQALCAKAEIERERS